MKYTIKYLIDYLIPFLFRCKTNISDDLNNYNNLVRQAFVVF